MAQRRYITRAVESRLTAAANQFPVVVLTGPRQTGKTTTLAKLFPNHHYRTLDDPVLRLRAVEDPAGFVDTLGDRAIVDEIQYAPGLLPYMKIAVDKERHRTGRFILTGSQIFPLMKGLGESLAGRAAILELLGLDLTEVPLASGISALFERIHCGTFPDVLVHGVDRGLFYGSYLQTYVERDVRQVENVQDVVRFQRFLELLAARVGGLLNRAELAKELGVSQPTVQRWLDVLELSRIIVLLRPYSNNITRRIVKSPKPYFTDTGLLAHLLRYPNPETLERGPQSGALVENFVVTEVLKGILHRGAQLQPYFFRDSNGNEIDLVLDHGRSVTLVEIKRSATIANHHVQSLLRLKELFPAPQLRIVSAYPEPIEIGPGVVNVPVQLVGRIGHPE